MTTHKEYYACRRKEAYSKKEAGDILVKRWLWKGTAGSIYLCDYCGWWHITKKPNKV